MVKPEISIKQKREPLSDASVALRQRLGAAGNLYVKL